MFTEHPLSGTMFSSGNSAVGRKPRPCFGRLHRVESVGKTDVDGGEMQDAVDISVGRELSLQILERQSQEAVLQSA